MLNLNNLELESDPNVNKLNLRIRWCEICWRLCTHSQKSIMMSQKLNKRELLCFVLSFL